MPFAALALSSAPTFAQGDVGYGLNLIQNPAGVDGMAGWTITENGGNGWTDLSDDDGFATSYGWAKREQLIDLYDFGYTRAVLDKMPPILASEVFTRWYCNDQYFLTIELLNTNMQVIDTWDSGVRTHQGSGCDYEDYHERLEHSFTGYGTGLRYVRWRDGGKDTEVWWGHFGTRLTNPILAVLPVNLLNNPDSLSSWQILENGGNGWREYPDGKMGTSYGWARRTQEIDLINDAGYSASVLDQGHPIGVAEHFAKSFCEDLYYLNVDLLDANRNVIASFASGDQTHSREECAWDSYTELLSYTFVDYGPGVRYIRWEDGGKDTEYWSGHYGTVLSQPYVGIFDLETDSPTLPGDRRRLGVGAILTGVGATTAAGAIVTCVLGGPYCLALGAGAAVITVAGQFYLGYEASTETGAAPEPTIIQGTARGRFAQREDNSWFSSGCESPFELDRTYTRCFCPNGQYVTDQGTSCTSTTPNKTRFISADPSYYSRTTVANLSGYSDSQYSSATLTYNSTIAMREYAIGTCLVGIVSLEPSPRMIIHPVNGKLSQKLPYFRCPEAKLKAGSAYTLDNIPQETWVSNEYTDSNGRLTLDWDKDQPPSHFTLSESLGLITDDDDLPVKGGAIGFFMQKVDDYTFAVDYNSRSLHTGKFKYNGKVHKTSDPACGVAKKNLPRCFPSSKWRTIITDTLNAWGS